MNDEIKKAAEILRNSKNCIALTGAGVSVESGIPDFRSVGGLWDKYDPAIYATIESFNSMPEKVWNMIFDMIDLVINAKPNPAHIAMAQLEEMGFLKAIVTQNIDNLHQEAGSKTVIEYHGNASKLECQKCGKKFDREIFMDRYYAGEKVPPRCDKCDKILKPSVVLFGEAIPVEALTKSQALAENADAVLVVGTSAIVYPAASIPTIAKRNGASVIEFNIEETDLTRIQADVFIKGSAGKTLPKLVKLLK